MSINLVINDFVGDAAFAGFDETEPLRKLVHPFLSKKIVPFPLGPLVPFEFLTLHQEMELQAVEHFFCAHVLMRVALQPAHAVYDLPTTKPALQIQYLWVF